MWLNPNKNNQFDRLNAIKTSNKFVLFDRNNINRGIIVGFENDDIHLSLNYPSTMSEIKSFYLLIKNICKNLNKETFYINNEKESTTANLNEIEYYIKQDYCFSFDILKQYSKKEFNFFGVVNLLCFGETEFKRIGLNKTELEKNTIDEFMINYERVLHNMQNINMFYAIPYCYKRNENFLFLLVPCPPECKTILPIDPIFDLNLYKYINPTLTQWSSINANYVACEFENKRYFVQYNFFLDFFKNSEKYDNKHVIINYNYTIINDLIKEHGIGEDDFYKTFE